MSYNSLSCRFVMSRRISGTKLRVGCCFLFMNLLIMPELKQQEQPSIKHYSNIKIWNKIQFFFSMLIWNQLLGQLWTLSEGKIEVSTKVSFWCDCIQLFILSFTYSYFLLCPLTSPVDLFPTTSYWLSRAHCTQHVKADLASSLNLLEEVLWRSTSVAVMETNISGHDHWSLSLALHLWFYLCRHNDTSSSATDNRPEPVDVWEAQWTGTQVARQSNSCSALCIICCVMNYVMVESF